MTASSPQARDAVHLGLTSVRSVDPVEFAEQRRPGQLPHLQLDVGAKYALKVKRELARRMAVRDLGEGSVWNAAVNDPVPAAVLSVETRRGRPPEQRARLASALIDACSEALDLNPEVLAVELTQHAGDENYRKFFVDAVLQGALGRDWTPDEPQKSLFEAMKTEVRRKAS